MKTHRSLIALAALGFVLSSASARAQTITTIAGAGLTDVYPEGDGNPALNASLVQPTDLAIDSAGNIYFSEASWNYEARGGCRVRRIDATTGIVTAFAGDGHCAYSGDGGPATAASLGMVYGIAFDAQDSLFITDYNNQVIRRVDAATGIITTVAGRHFVWPETCAPVGDGGPATEACLANPIDVAIDHLGRLLIADNQHGRIRRVDLGTGTITTVAGPGGNPYVPCVDGAPALDSPCVFPLSVAVDSADNIYFSEGNYLQSVYRIDATTGILTRRAGVGSQTVGFSGDGGPATAAQLNVPWGVNFDSAGNLFFADRDNNRIRRVDAQTGVITTVAGNGLTHASAKPEPVPGDGGPATASPLRPLSAIADGRGNLLIADAGQNRLRKVAAALAASDGALPEGDTGSAPLDLLVSLLPAATETPVTVDYTTVPGTAVAGVDFSPVSGSLTFVPGSSRLAVSIPINGDIVDEHDETFTLHLSNAQGAALFRADAVGTIVDDDPLAGLSVGDATVPEGDVGTAVMTFQVTLSTTVEKTVTVIWETSPGSARSGQDYVAASGVLTFAPGVTTRSLDVVVNGDLLDELNETFFVTLSAVANAVLADPQGLGAIQDDDAPLAFTSSSAGLPALAHAASALGDVDGDGDLDVALSGCLDSACSSRVAQLLINTGGTFAASSAVLPAVSDGALAFGDFDNDGDLDLVVSGTTDGVTGGTWLYRQEAGSFVSVTPVPFAALWASALAWADFDGDGDLDLGLAASSAGPYATRVYRNDGGVFVEAVDFASGVTPVQGGCVATGDYDGDGRVDLVVGGAASAGRATRVYRNDGTYLVQSATLAGVDECAVALGDYDMDGDLDVGLAGTSDGGGLLKVYRNDAGAFVDVGSGLAGVERARAAWGDLDNDGDPDLVVSGDTGATGATRVYRNDAGQFTDLGVSLPDVVRGALSLGELDGDGDLDLLLVGQEGAGLESSVARNESPTLNTLPQGVAGLTAVVDLDGLHLSWNASSDNETPAGALTYNLRLGVTPGGSQVFTAMADPATGVRAVVADGNAGRRLGLLVRDLPYGSYYWSVQAVDAAYAGSAFSNVATATVSPDQEPPQVTVLSPSGGDYWLLSEAGQSAKTQLVTWAMSDNERICRVEVALLYSTDGGASYVAAAAEGGLPIGFGPGGDCVAPGEGRTSTTYTMPTAFPAGRAGALYKIEVRVTDHVGLLTTVASPNPFYIVQANPDTVRTLILKNTARMQAVMGVTPAQAAALDTKVQELAENPRVLGKVVDLGGVTDVGELYAAWDAEPANPLRANHVLFGCHGSPLPTGCTAERDGIQDAVRSLLRVYSGVKYVVLVGDDRIIPFARVKDRTYLLPEQTYTTGGDLTTVSTVGQALAGNTYLTDDALGLRRPITEDLLGDAVLPDLLPDLAVGRLVETPEEIATAIATFIAQDGVLDLASLDPVAGHKVLVTGYDFLVDSGNQIARRWKAFFPTVEGALAPVDSRLVDDQLWGFGNVEERQAALETHLGGNGGMRYGVTSLNGHAAHYLEGVPGTSNEDIQGLGSDRIAALNLAGGVVYAVGCHGGLPVPGSDIADLDHSLDLPQTLLARGVVAYVANTGYGWGLRYGIGYSERLVQILTEEMTAGGTVVTGDAVKRTKQRYYLESPRYDVYDEKSLMQWTLYGLPMYAVKTGIAVASASPSLVAGRAPEWPSSSLGKIGVEATQIDGPLPSGRGETTVPDAPVPPGRDETTAPDCRGGACLRPALAPPPSYVTQLNLRFDLTAAGVYRKWTARGYLETNQGCSDGAGCYYTLNGLVERSTGSGDLPVQPYFVYDSRLSGTSQHGVLWKGGMYLQESGWIPVLAQLESNGGDASDHGDLARTIVVGPVHRRLRAGAGGAEATSCPASDAEMSSVVVPTGESVRDGVGQYSIERTYRTMDLEVFYFNNTVDGVGNCDREGPSIGAGPFAGVYHQARGATIEWRVPAADTAGVWRVVVVATDGRLDAQSHGKWESVELADIGGGVWAGIKTFGGGEQVTYLIQAVDARGNVTWLPFVATRQAASRVPLGVPRAVDLDVPAVGAVQLSQAAYSVSEVAGVARLTVTRTGETSGEATVAYAASSGTASPTTDYLPTSGILTFAPGESSRTLAVALINDALAEDDETVIVALADPSGVSLGAPSVATLTIADDDVLSTVAFRQAAYSVEESGPVAVIAVTRTGGLTSAVTIDYAMSDGTATVGRDYVASGGEVYFRPGETEKTFLVPILVDSLVEENETLTLTLSSPTGGATLGAQSTATLTIVDDERQVQFALAAISAGEALPRATVTVKRIGVLTGALTVEYFTAPGTATENVDYGATSGYLSFASGVVSKTFTIPLVNDTLDEPNETILLGLRNVTGGVTGPINASVLTILDNDVAGTLQFSLPTYSITETGGAATITVSRSGGTASGVSVGYTTSNGTATAGADYAATSGALTFDAARTTATFVVPVTDDALSEGVETVNLTLSSPGGGGLLGLRPTAVLSIVDDETAVGIATPDLTVTEGAAAAITVRRTGSLAGVVTVPYTTTNGSAASGSDYSAKTGSLTFGNNVSQVIVSVPTLQDTLNEPDETFTLTLGTPSGSPAPPLGAATATVTIRDNDPAGSLSFSLANAVVSEAIGLATVTVKRTGGTASGVTVHYATSDGTATVAQDYTHSEGTLSFGAGQVVQTFKVPILNDTTAEGAETIQLTLSAPVGGATLGGVPTALLTIKDNDGSGFRFGSPKYSVSEAGRLVTITVRREGDRTRPATVSYDVAGGTGQSGADFAVSPGALSFAAGAVSRSFTVRVVDDTLDEADRTVALMLSAPSSGHHLGYPYEATLTITDDDRAGVVQFSTVLVSEVEPDEGETTEVTVAVTRSGGSSSGVTVDYATSDGTAETGTDYVATSGTLTFGSGETRKSFTVTLLGDGIAEGNETIGLTLTNPTNGAELGVQDEATLWSVEESGAASLAVVADPLMEVWLADEGGGLARALRAHNYRAEVVEKVEAALGSRAEVVVLPLRLASKAAYRALLASLAKRPQTLFVLVTPPPLPEAMTTAADAARARAISTWLVRDALVGYKTRNVAVFDMFNILTSRAEASSAPTGEGNDAGFATGNHHRLWAGNVEHVQHEPGDVLRYANDDGLRKATEELLPLLNLAYSRWKAQRAALEPVGAGEAAAPTEATRQATPVGLGPPTVTTE